jgi:hypothetical protein
VAADGARIIDFVQFLLEASGNGRSTDVANFQLIQPHTFHQRRALFPLPSRFGDIEQAQMLRFVPVSGT